MNPAFTEGKCIYCGKEYGDKICIDVPMRFGPEWEIFRVHEECEDAHNAKIKKLIDENREKASVK